MNLTMNTFRAAVKAAMVGAQIVAPVPVKDPEKAIWDFFFSKIGNAYGVAGLMGNLYAESGLSPINLQNSYNKKLNITDEEYTKLVDVNNYPDFVTDKAGYGLAQWTYHTRKKALLEFAKKKGTSIGDLNMQLEFLWTELQGYKSVLSTLKGAGDVRSASNAVLTGFEKPADQGITVQSKRASYGEGYYKKFAKAETTGCPFMVRVSITGLNIRKGPGTDTEKTGKCTGVGVFTIVEVKAGIGSDSGWGKLKSGAGWISLDYCKRV